MRWVKGLETVLKNADTMEKEELAKLYEYYMEQFICYEEELTMAQGNKVYKQLQELERRAK